MIELKHLEKSYGNSTPLKDVNVVIHDGDVISVIGPSGAGKSTLIRCINMLERPTGGQILLDGEDITSRDFDLTLARRRMGMVFQSFNLFGHLTVIENLMLAQIDILKRSKQEAYDTGVELLKRVGLSGRESQYPDELSGGQKQRVAIARTLAMDPDVILLDEPTSALDPTMVGEVQSVIRDLARSGKTMMIVTHEMSFARAICNRVFYVDEGGIYEDGTPEQIFEHPKKELTRRFIHRLKVLEFTVECGRFDAPAADAEIDRFCFRNDVPPRIRHRIHLIFEELFQQILLPVLQDTDMRITIEYSEKEKQLEIKSLYNGEAFNPADTENRLSLKILQGMTDEMIHSTESAEGYRNTFICRFREKES